MKDVGEKLPGKKAYADRRRPVTRTSGFKVHPETTGGEYITRVIGTHHIKAGQTVTFDFRIQAVSTDSWVGIGSWFYATGRVRIQQTGLPNRVQLNYRSYDAPNWSKFGSMWRSANGGEIIIVGITAAEDLELAIYEAGCGVIEHPHLADARPALLRNMSSFSPEANRYAEKGLTRIDHGLHGKGKMGATLYLKSCNRCALFLPFNPDSERSHLSFTNHCVASHIIPCSHTSFGNLRDKETDAKLRLNYGFQLECRFCKKFEVNSAHNPQRTKAQMREDGTRRRAFEHLLTELRGESPLLSYRRRYGRELFDDVEQRFQNKCFKCCESFEAENPLQLDHTRPLAMLWPLDETATALCRRCNTEKRDRAPAEFYSTNELQRLSTVTGVPFSELKDPTPNSQAIEQLMSKLDWFFEDFLQRPEMQKAHDGKTAARAIVRALRKTLHACPDPTFAKRFERIRRKYGIS